MAQVQFFFDVPLNARTVVDALTDFTERRPDIWPDLDPDIYEVIELHDTSAVVREGQRSPRLWALEEYDWSTPGTVTWTARDSNFCAPGSFMSAGVEARDDGGSRVHITWNRTGVSLKGKLIVALVRLSRGRPLAKSLAAALSALEPRVALHDGAPG
jgi:hypothetical protein